MRRSPWIAALFVVLLVPPAFALQNGDMLLRLQVGGGSADWVQPAGTAGYITSQPALPEIRVGGELWRVVSDHAAVSLGGGLGFFSETDKPGALATPGASEQKSTNTTIHVRLGQDMFANVGEHMILHGGGGLGYSNGRFKYEVGSTSLKAPRVNTYSIDGRVGLMMKLSHSVWGGGHLGHTFGLASAEMDGAKASWTTKNLYGEADVVFRFGGN